MSMAAILRYSFAAGSFCLGRCSYDKMKSLIKEYGRFERHSKGANVKPYIYNGKNIIGLDEANMIIGNAIEAGLPFMAGRYGSVETGAIWKVRDDGRGFICPAGLSLKALCNNAGFFPEDKNLMLKFADEIKRATYHVDIMALFFWPMEEWLLRNYENNPVYCRIEDLNPFFSSCPWSAKLEGKKVLVIHPFDKTIQAQYKKRELLFPGKNILPEFELITQRAVQTIAGNKDERFATWFDALDYMYDEAMKKDFDVAIIGCGAYGFPLAARIKQAGRIAIHLGGVTQMLFGIKGKRWENSQEYAEMVNNPAWVRPEERPEGLERVEGGCYW